MNDSGRADAKPNSPRSGRIVRIGLIALAALVVLVGIFYVEENSRGKSAWAASKSALETQREVLDWSAYIPPAVPDDQNFFKAPKMQDWFVGKGSNELTSRLSLVSFEALTRQARNTNIPVLLAEWLLRPSAIVEDSRSIKFENFRFDGTPLSNALQQLADAGNLKIQIDPHVDSSPASAVTGTWTNVSAQAALLALVCNSNLHWTENSDTGVALISVADLNSQIVGPDPASIILGMLKKAIAPAGEAAEGFALGADLVLQIGPMQLSVPPDGVPAKAQMLRLFPGSVLRVEPAGNAIRVSLSPFPIAAADYLKWSDQFSPQFDLIRDAVKRPASRIEGDYERFDQVPTVNFTAAESAARTMADRARSHLMLNQPGPALAELTLLHDFLGCLARPGGKPLTIAAAAGIETFHALYAETVAFGLRTQTWGEPQLTVLQQQLSQVDLVSLVWSAMESDRAWRCRFIETAPRSEVAQSVGLGGPSATFSEKLRNRKYLVFKFMPEGWIDQNLARMAPLRQGDIDSLDRALGVVHPQQVEQARQQDLAAYRAASPFSMLAKLETPPLGPTLTAAARVQALVNETQVVVALERGRLARGVYPDRLEALAPEFIPVIPVDPIDGGSLRFHRLPGGRFLLYSIGWDEKDDNGAPIDAQGNGDWVWGGR